MEVYVFMGSLAPFISFLILFHRLGERPLLATKAAQDDPRRAKLFDDPKRAETVEQRATWGKQLGWTDRLQTFHTPPRSFASSDARRGAAWGFEDAVVCPLAEGAWWRAGSACLVVRPHAFLCLLSTFLVCYLICLIVKPPFSVVFKQPVNSLLASTAGCF